MAKDQATVSISKQYRKKLKELAKSQSRSMSACIEYMISEKQKK